VSDTLRVAVAGNPNAGKTSLFNLLTGSRYKVGNYPGVTVETREGTALDEFGGDRLRLIDLPGTYSLTPISEDEVVAYRALTGHAEAPAPAPSGEVGGGAEEKRSAAPDAILLVVDATNLARNLYLALQILELGVPCVVALNMVDLAEEAGLCSDADAVAEALGVPVIATDARRGRGLPELTEALLGLELTTSSRFVEVGEEESELRPVLDELEQASGDPARARWLLAAAAAEQTNLAGNSEEQAALSRFEPEQLRAATERLVVLRYAEVDRLLALLPEGSTGTGAPAMKRSARIDRFLTHPWLGPLAFVMVMALVFQSIFSWSEPMMGVIESGVGVVADAVAGWMGPGLFTDLITEGVIGGVGNVLVFVPQIALLFLFIGLLEDSGYMARAAFIIDRPMAKVGLSGRSFVPLLSGYACAIPAIMGARTLPRFRDRLITILMIPFMSCSARLPIFSLIIASLFDADRQLLGPFSLGGVILLGLYLLSTLSALGMGAIYKRTLLPGPTPPLMLELPPYRVPRLRNTVRHVYDRTKDFVRDAGTIILAVTVVLWGLLHFPSVDPEQLPDGETAIEHSIGGRVGKAMEPALEPIGQDWRMGIGIIGSFAAREVMVSTLGLVYGIEGADEDDAPLRETLATATDEETGDKRYTPLGGLALMVFFVYAAQCMSTLAVVKRETRSWRWPIFMFVSMTAIAYLAALLVYQVGRALGFA
jgi:ferrous iron transport protein B